MSTMFDLRLPNRALCRIEFDETELQNVFNNIFDYLKKQDKHVKELEKNLQKTEARLGLCERDLEIEKEKTKGYEKQFASRAELDKANRDLNEAKMGLNKELTDLKKVVEDKTFEEELNKMKKQMEEQKTAADHKFSNFVQEHQDLKNELDVCNGKIKSANEEIDELRRNSVELAQQVGDVYDVWEMEKEKAREVAEKETEDKVKFLSELPTLERVWDELERKADINDQFASVEDLDDVRRLIIEKEKELYGHISDLLKRMTSSEEMKEMIDESSRKLMKVIDTKAEKEDLERQKEQLEKQLATKANEEDVEKKADKEVIEKALKKVNERLDLLREHDYTEQLDEVEHNIHLLKKTKADKSELRKFGKRMKDAIRFEQGKGGGSSSALDNMYVGGDSSSLRYRCLSCNRGAPGLIDQYLPSAPHFGNWPTTSNITTSPSRAKSKEESFSTSESPLLKSLKESQRKLFDSNERPVARPATAPGSGGRAEKLNLYESHFEKMTTQSLTPADETVVLQGQSRPNSRPTSARPTSARRSSSPIPPTSPGQQTQVIVHTQSPIVGSDGHYYLGGRDIQVVLPSTELPQQKMKGATSPPPTEEQQKEAATQVRKSPEAW